MSQVFYITACHIQYASTKMSASLSMQQQVNCHTKQGTN